MNITKKAKIEFIKEMLRTSSAWQLRALTVIYDRQTPMEKATESTEEDNNIGFSGAHAEICSSFAMQYQSRGSLSPKQMSILAKIMPRYWKQILSVTDDTKLITSMLKHNKINEVQAFTALT